MMTIRYNELTWSLVLSGIAAALSAALFLGLRLPCLLDTSSRGTEPLISDSPLVLTALFIPLLLLVDDLPLPLRPPGRASVGDTALPLSFVGL
jgi:hypothetical protein